MLLEIAVGVLGGLALAPVVKAIVAKAEGVLHSSSVSVSATVAVPPTEPKA